MSRQITTLIIVLILSTSIFYYWEFALKESSLKKDYRLWVFTWLSIIIIAFLSMNMMVFTIATAILILISGKLVSNKLALFCFLLVIIPPYPQKIPLIVINIVRELSILLLLPIFFQAAKDSFYAERPRLTKFGSHAVDKLVVLFLILKGILYFRGIYEPIDPEPVTEIVRKQIYMFFQYFLPYFVASRYIKNFDELKKVLFAIVVAGMVAGVIGTYEFANGWLLFGDLHKYLGVPRGDTQYVLRSGAVRAYSSLEHPLFLGLYVLVTSGLYLFISKYIKNNFLKLIGAVLLFGGIVAPLSRGPWVGVVVTLSVFFTFWSSLKRVFLFFMMALISFTAILVSPYGDKFIDLIPFVGKADKFNVDYRADLITQSWLIIKQYPLLGVNEPTRQSEMEVMIQGQGIVDIVNYYLFTVLQNGIVGLMLIIGIVISLLYSLIKKVSSIKDTQSDEMICGKSITALFIGVLLCIATLSPMPIVNTILFLTFGIIISFLRVAKIDSANHDIPQDKLQNEYPTTIIVNKN